MMKKILTVIALILAMAIPAMAQKVEPKFPGGDTAIMQFIAKNLRYPPICVENGVEGRVKVEITVLPDSTISATKIVAPIDPDLEAEALRIIKLMPKWTPGTIDGKAAKLNTIVTFNFRLK